MYVDCIFAGNNGAQDVIMTKKAIKFKNGFAEIYEYDERFPDGCEQDFRYFIPIKDIIQISQ